MKTVYITHEYDPLYRADSIEITNVWNDLEAAREYVEFVRKESLDIHIDCYKATPIKL